MAFKMKAGKEGPMYKNFGIGKKSPYNKAWPSREENTDAHGNEIKRKSPYNQSTPPVPHSSRQPKTKTIDGIEYKVNQKKPGTEGSVRTSSVRTSKGEPPMKQISYSKLMPSGSIQKERDAAKAKENAKAGSTKGEPPMKQMGGTAKKVPTRSSKGESPYMQRGNQPKQERSKPIGESPLMQRGGVARKAVGSTKGEPPMKQMGGAVRKAAGRTVGEPPMKQNFDAAADQWKHSGVRKSLTTGGVVEKQQGKAKKKKDLFGNIAKGASKAVKG